jgi:hypothetical protein
MSRQWVSLWLRVGHTVALGGSGHSLQGCTRSPYHTHTQAPSLRRHLHEWIPHSGVVEALEGKGVKTLYPCQVCVYAVMHVQVCMHAWRVHVGVCTLACACVGSPAMC